MLRAIIVDDEELSLKRMKGLLMESGEVDDCHVFMNPLEAYEFIKMNPIDIIFLDINMPGINGMRFANLVFDLHASIHVVFVTGYDHYAVQAFEKDALDYLMKPVSAERLSKTWGKIRKGQKVSSTTPSIESFTTPKMVKVSPHPHVMLTDREMRILRLVTEGLTNKEIGTQMNITAETVKSHMKNMYRKLDVNSRIQAIQRATELKILG
ncbi:response regulator transcription factor [Paenibacillus qinlingensis]|uniref:response regulator transcription factor n=1 Tax=Paenibacillus qinlingensis TaxID=1837343 RepID=UPI0015647654|nr:response regulator transcription factor [Paenibacillus qinlingensis]NQX60666.1 response regulator transcription factor [Paenibacillus qinlingensis]